MAEEDSEVLPLLPTSRNGPHRQSSKRRLLSADTAAAAAANVGRWFGLGDEQPLLTERRCLEPHSEVGETEPAAGEPAVPAASQPPRPAASAIYFHGDLTAEDARRRLKSHAEPDQKGLYLVRHDDAMDAYILCLLHQDRVYQFLLERGTKVPSKYCFTSISPTFDTIDDMIAHYHTRKGGLPTRLMQPCPKTKSFRASIRKSFRAAVTTVSGAKIDDAEAAAAASSRRYLETPIETAFKRDEHSTRSREPRDDSSESECSSPAPNESSTDSRTGTFVEYEMPAESTNKRYEIVGTVQFTPYFIRIISFIQFIIIVVLCWKGGIHNLGFQPKEETRQVQTGFSRNLVDGTFIVSPNLFVGPDTLFLIKWGAKHDPCMRKDTQVFTALARQRSEEEQLYGCCQGTDGVRICGQTTVEGCPPTATFLGVGTTCPATSCDTFVLRPCCVSINGSCEIITQDECDFKQGIYHDEAQLCSEVSCLKDICGFTLNADEPNQWYRFFLTYLLHAGIVHYLMNMLLQLLVGCRIERRCGWFRMMLMYTTAGFGSSLLSGVFAPTVPLVGCSGAAYGLLGIALVELLHSWRVEKRPWGQLFSLLFEIVLFLMVGTLPFVDNFAHIGGLVFGIFAAMAFLPYITFGRWNRIRKALLVVVGLLAIIILLIVLLVYFYRVQSIKWCMWCHYLQCVPYSKGFCDRLTF